MNATNKTLRMILLPLGLGSLLLSSMAGNVLAQATEEWVATYHGLTNNGAAINGVAVDGSGNVYVTGSSLGASGNTDYTTIKYDSNGNELWVASYNGPGNSSDDAIALSIDVSGNVYVTGRSVGIGSDYDYATIKYDTNGNQLWVARYNGPGNGPDWATALIVDPSRNVYVTGSSVGTGDNEDYATIKYDPNGNQLWVARYDGPANNTDGATALMVDVSSKVYVTGSSIGSGGNEDYATIKYDAIGNQLWVARYNGPGNDGDDANAVTVDGSGNVYVTGRSAGAGTNDDYATIKYDTNGNQLWVARYNGPGNNADFAAALRVDLSGNVYVTGSSMGAGSDSDYATIKYDANGNQLWLARYDGPTHQSDIVVLHSLAVDDFGNAYVTGSSIGAGTNFDYATIKYDANGNELWVERYNDPDNEFDSPSALTIDGSGHVYVTGLGACTGSPLNCDAVTVKYSQPTSAADLIISALSTTATTVAQGQTLPVMNTVLNQGTGPADASTVRFILSITPTGGEAAVIPLPTVRSVGPLAPGESSTATTMVSFPPTVPIGNFYICAMANADGTVYETGGNNNLLCSSSTITITPGVLPDLVMTTVTPTVATAIQGGTLPATDTVSNAGTADTGIFRIAYHLSTNAIYGDGDDIVLTTIRTVTTLAAGASDSATTSLSIPASAPGGTYHLCALADSVNQVVESDETNNTFCSGATVALPFADLVITALSTGATVLAPGQSLSATSSVMNQGSIPVGTFRIGFYLSINPDGSTTDAAISTTRTLSSLAAGASSTGTTGMTVPASTPPNQYYLCAVADSLNQVAESDEGNNRLCTSGTFQVTLPDLTMTAVTPNAATATKGGTLSVTTTVSNGGSASGVFRIAFFLSSNTIGGGYLVTTTRVVTSLAAGASSTGTTNLTIPGSMSSGDFYICTFADSLDQVTETNEVNNSLCSSTTVHVP